jgi:hypothetical protein
MGMNDQNNTNNPWEKKLKPVEKNVPLVKKDAPSVKKNTLLKTEVKKENPENPWKNALKPNETKIEKKKQIQSSEILQDKIKKLNKTDNTPNPLQRPEKKKQIQSSEILQDKIKKLNKTDNIYFILKNDSNSQNSKHQDIFNKIKSASVAQNNNDTKTAFNLSVAAFEELNSNDAYKNDPSSAWSYALSAWIIAETNPSYFQKTDLKNTILRNLTNLKTNKKLINEYTTFFAYEEDTSSFEKNKGLIREKKVTYATEKDYIEMLDNAINALNKI